LDPPAPRTAELSAALRHDLEEFRLRAGRPADDALSFPAPRGEPRRDHDYRNWPPYIDPSRPAADLNRSP
jgi:hypothetical protein